MAEWRWIRTPGTVSRTAVFKSGISRPALSSPVPRGPGVLGSGGALLPSSPAETRLVQDGPFAIGLQIPGTAGRPER